MKSSIILVLLLLFSVALHGQKKEKTEDQKLFDKAADYFYDEEYDSAIFVFRKFIETFPNSDLKGRAHYNLGFTNFKKENYAEAKQIFLDILNQPYNEYAPNGLMEQYTLYKHRSCEHLTEIYLLESNYSEALRYTRLFDKKYPYKHFCGNEIRAYEIYKARCYARIYEGQQQYKKAINTLLPFLFDDGLASNTDLLNDLIRITGKVYDKEVLKIELSNAVSSLKIRKTRHDEHGMIKVLGKSVVVHSDGLFGLNNVDYQNNLNLEGEALYRKAILTNDFFKHYLQ